MPFKIIYIDDEPDLCLIMTEILSDAATEVLTFTDPELGIREISANPPNLVMIDFRLPGVTGVQLARRLSQSIPKILVSGDLELDPQGLFLKHFRKPLDFVILKAFIADLRDPGHTRPTRSTLD